MFSKKAILALVAVSAIVLGSMTTAALAEAGGDGELNPQPLPPVAELTGWFRFVIAGDQFRGEWGVDGDEEPRGLWNGTRVQ